MWSPGTLLHVRSQRVDDVFERGGSRGFPTGNKRRKGKLALVISVRQTGYGTKGPKWDALILGMDRLIELKDVWRFEDWFVVHRDPSHV